MREKKGLVTPCSLSIGDLHPPARIIPTGLVRQETCGTQERSMRWGFKPSHGGIKR
jgi:hypothetical protein